MLKGQDVRNGSSCCPPALNWRPEADVGQDPKASDATAAQPGKWHRANTQDKADQETFTQSVHATVSHNTCINKEKLKDDLGEVSIDSHRLDEVGGEGVVKVAEHEAGALDRHTASGAHLLAVHPHQHHLGAEGGLRLQALLPADCTRPPQLGLGT